MSKGVTLLIGIAVALGVFASTSSALGDLTFARSEDPAPAGVAFADELPEATTTASTTSTTTPSTTTTASTTIAPTTSTTEPSPHADGVLIIGDSILEGLNILQYNFGANTVFDTEVARSVLHLPLVVGEHEVPQNLVIHLGTNGWWPNAGAAMAELLSTFDDRRIVLVNLSVDRPYTAAANDDIAAVAASLDHVQLVDWAEVATTDLVRADGYHPNLAGYEALARLIADALGLPADAQLVPPTTVTPELAGQPR